MGEALRIIFVFNWTFDLADVISIIGIIVNSALAYWIVKTIQNKLANKRVLKDHFISELKDLRFEYKDFINNIHNGSLLPKITLRKFKQLEIKKRHLFKNLLDLYKINDNKLNEFHNEFRELITNSSEYTLNFRSNSPITYAPITIRGLNRIQTNYDGTFNNLIIQVNDAN